jgi:hypothetical protein
MTQFDPSLRVRRMVIMRGAHSVYDEKFHRGVNVIRGENSSGKSTVLNFIHYGLGGDVSEWSDMALLCDQVFIEVELSGKTVTLSRSISDSDQQPMEVFFGGYESARAAPVSEWDRFPYRRSSNKESFSQILFRQLGVPEAAEEDTGNITMHQMLRLLYADQLAPVDQIFSNERWDDAKLREAIGRLLCGAFDNELYANQLDIRATEKRFDAANAELRSLFAALGNAGHDLTPAWVVEQRARNEQERRQVGQQIDAIQRGAETNDAPELTMVAQEDAYNELVTRQRQIALVRGKRDALELAMADSASFIASLETKLEALKDAALVADKLGPAQFSSCPACYASIGPVAPGSCGLCKEPLDADVAAERLGGLINETALQLRQSKLLQEDRAERLLEAEAELSAIDLAWRQAAARYSEAQSRPTTEKQYALTELYKRLGYLDRRDEDLTEKARLIEIISGLSAQKEELNARLNRLRQRNDQLFHVQKGRLDDAYFTISSAVRELLKLDLKRQDSFENPQRVDFSFGDNKISVDGHTYFSASSRAILKSAFFLGLHVAAANREYFRHPRFLMLDTIEDKGMEAARSQNFQRLIVQVVEAAASESQVIFGTAMVAGELNNETYSVGRFYTRDNPSLDFGR